MEEKRNNNNNNLTESNENIVDVETEDMMILDANLLEVNLVYDVEELKKDIKIEFDSQPINKIVKTKRQKAKDIEEKNKKEEKPLKPNRSEKKKIRVINRLIAGEINGTKAAKLLKITTRQVRNLKRQMLTEGETGVIHKNRYHKPINTYAEDIRKELAKTYRAEFRGTNFTEFARLMQERGCELSRSTIYNILRENRIRSPQRKKVKRKKVVATQTTNAVAKTTNAAAKTTNAAAKTNITKEKFSVNK